MQQTYILHGRGQWDKLVAFVKANVSGAMLLGVTVFDANEKKRSNEQNRFYWKTRMEYLQDNAYVQGVKFSKEAWHHYISEMFCPRIEIVLPYGEIKSVRISTSDMKVGEFSEYVQQIDAWAATELGIEFP